MDQNKPVTLDSREVAKMVDKDHHKLLRDIREYISQMKEANEDNPKMDTPLNPDEYFIESTYINSQNKEQPCYEITKMGCDFIAHKMRGVKGTAFTALYIRRFYEMQNPQIQLKKYSYMIEDPAERARVWANEFEEKKKIEAESKGKDEVIEHKENVIINLVDEVSLAQKRQVLNRVVRYKGANFQKRWRELYKQFEMKYHINLNIRLDHYNREHKPKLRNKLDYIDKVMGKIPEIYEIACKIYENDIKELVQQMYELNSSKKIS
ncbi:MULTISPECIES: Rha family transcriptional regulator [Clostridium]|uniref:Phage regulatory protein Rha (Phage_pRha) n=3 Tax=Clostridium TaxID=1485 RepID=D8GK13_CLOLD|nr:MULTISPECIES: Rha family transcriptional regulator [Clostridium]ADK13131.1 putative phage protein [Clostridium ljungdahlii DSM 13528]AGY76354.1 Rha family transcriptional regulator [Clostridium autoethanogenum DSM 10061]ALU36517.1 Phage regulatory protein Rha family [Clostridium autoethanogenum DSM 10061]OAA84369.1 Phage regulatory protein Rha (Phage_pRha) [Clostridium ljungdahlii DSM 13528]OVY48603.1 Phage regulatory protein Rha (Phage_pRha) [Clostridium autoethanogenum]